MSSIRLTYSGLIGLVVRIASLATGLIFSVLVTRNLTIADFGLYSLIGSLIAYAMFGHIISAYWIPREIARGKEVGRTGLLTNGIFSLAGTIAYLIAAYVVAQNTESDFSILLLGAILIPATYISNSLDNINQGFKPQGISYALISFEIAKIPLGFLLLEGTALGLTGAILATFFALVAKICVGAFFAWPRLKVSINISYLIRWLKLSWLSLYDGLSSNIYVFDTMIVAVILGSTEPLAYFAAAMTVSIIASHAGVLAIGLGPKLISETRIEYVRTVLRLFTLIGIPLFVAVIVFAKPLLFLLNPAYSLAVPVVYIISFRVFLYTIFTIFYSILWGIEKVDINKNANFSQYRKSNLFLLGTVKFVRAGQYIGSLILIIIISQFLNMSTIDIVILWALVSLLADVSITTYSFFKVKRAGFLSFDWKSAIKYIVTAVISGIISLIMIENFVVYERDLTIFLPGLAMSLAAGGVVYFVSMYFLDNYMRSLVRAVFRKTG